MATKTLKSLYVVEYYSGQPPEYVTAYSVREALTWANARYPNYEVTSVRVVHQFVYDVEFL